MTALFLALFVMLSLHSPEAMECSDCTFDSEEGHHDGNWMRFCTWYGCPSQDVVKCVPMGRALRWARWEWPRHDHLHGSAGHPPEVCAIDDEGPWHGRCCPLYRETGDRWYGGGAIGDGVRTE